MVLRRTVNSIVLVGDSAGTFGSLALSIPGDDDALKETKILTATDDSVAVRLNLALNKFQR